MSFAGVDLDSKLAESAKQQGDAPAQGAQSAGSGLAPPSSQSNGTEIGNGAKDLGSAPASNNLTIQQMVELDKLERFKWNGREWTPKELQDAALRHEDYTRKTQEAAQERKQAQEELRQAREDRKFASNFAADLELVKENPALLAELKKIYPADYVKVAERILKTFNNSVTETPATAGVPQGGLDEARVQRLLQQQLEERLNPLLEWKESTERAQTEAQVEARGRELDEWFDKYSKKYPDADPEVINARAMGLAQQKVQISEAILEKLFKSHHEAVGKRYAERQKQKNEEQLKANRSAQDAGPGGGVPGKAPVEVKTLKEAARRMEQEILAGRIA